MADDNEVPAWAQVIAGLGAGASGGPNAALDWSKFRAEQAQKKQLLEQQQQEINMKQQQMSMQLYQTANTQMSSIMEGALMAGDPEAYMNANSESWRRWASYGDIKQPFEDAVSQVRDGAKVLGPYQKTVRDAIATIQDPNITFEKKRALYSAASQDIDRAKAAARNGVFIAHWGTQKTVLDEVYSKASAQEVDLKKANIAANARVTVGTGREGAEDKKLGQIAAENYAKAVQALPALDERLARLKESLGLVDKVFTGPVSGSTPFEFAQRAMGSAKDAKSKEAANKLAFIFNNERVSAIKQMANEAGARSADANAEADRIASTVAGTQYEPQTLKEIINSQILYLENAKRIAKEQQRWKSSGKPLADYYSNQEGYGMVQDMATEGATNPNSEPRGAASGLTSSERQKRIQELKDQINKKK